MKNRDNLKREISKSIAIYPELVTESFTDRVKTAVQRAYKYHVNEIFTTIHLPEFTLDEQLAAFGVIAEEAKKSELEVTVDIGGNFIARILKDPDKMEFLKKVRFDFIRLDYGYCKEQLIELYHRLEFRGFVLNASMYDQKETDEVIAMFRSIDEHMEIRACHNFYIRENSGLDGKYAMIQDSYLIKYGIPVYYCIPSYTHPRGPLGLGLCTLEKHRYQSIRYVLADLILNYRVKAFMLADEWLEETDYLEMEETLKLLDKPLHEEEVIEVDFFDGVTEMEKNIVLQRHIFRKDSPERFLRSRSSREMAEFACNLNANRIADMEEGTITIDNERNKRYSGELRVITRKTEKEDGTNVVAKLAQQQDLVKLMRFREGVVYRFLEREI